MHDLACSPPLTEGAAQKLRFLFTVKSKGVLRLSSPQPRSLPRACFPPPPSPARPPPRQPRKYRGRPARRTEPSPPHRLPEAPWAGWDRIVDGSLTAMAPSPQGGGGERGRAKHAGSRESRRLLARGRAGFRPRERRGSAAPAAGRRAAAGSVDKCAAAGGRAVGVARHGPACEPGT